MSRGVGGSSTALRTRARAGARSAARFPAFATSGSTFTRDGMQFLAGQFSVTVLVQLPECGGGIVDFRCINHSVVIGIQRRQQR